MAWLTARSAGEILAVAALVISAVALVVVLGDADAPGSLRESLVGLSAWADAQVNVVMAIAVLTTLGLTVALTVAGRACGRAAAQARQLSRALAAAQVETARLEATLKARDELLLTVVHELRTPLTHVAGYAELMSGGVRPRRPEEIGEMSAAIQSASATMLRLMDDLVEMTRLQSDRFGLKARPVDLVQLIRGTVGGFEVQPHRHRLVVELPDHWLTVLADPERVRQVLANLLMNAISYSPAGGEVRVRARSEGSVVRVEVEDQGIGLAPEDQARVFERFYRTRQARMLREQGSGLGLAIVKYLVEAQGGEIGVRSEVGVGSTFWFTLRAANELAGRPEAQRRAERPVSVTPSA